MARGARHDAFLKKAVGSTTITNKLSMANVLKDSKARLHEMRKKGLSYGFISTTKNP